MRSIPVQYRLLPLRSLHRSYSQSLFCSGEPLVILFPRRFSRPTFASGVVGFLSEICTVRLGFPAPPLSPLSPSLFPPPLPLPRSGQRVLSRKRIWKWVETMVLTSFGLVLLLFCLPPRNRQCIFYNAAMSRWPEVVCRPHRLRLASFGTPINPRFPHDNL